MPTTERVRAWRYALDPSATQEQALASHVGAARFAYNACLHHVKAVLDQRAAEATYGVGDLVQGPAWNAYALRGWLGSVKDDVAPWWRENSKEAFASGAADLAQALKAWKASRSGKRAGRPVGFPRFRSRRSATGCRFTTGAMRLSPDRHHVVLPRIGSVHTHESTRRLARLVESGRARITSVTVSRSASGRWYASVLARVTVPEPSHPHPGRAVGIDVGVKHLLTAAEPGGTPVLVVDMPASAVREAELARALTRRTSRRQGPRRGVSPSKRWLRARRRVDRHLARSRAIREDALHKATSDLAARYGTVVVEDLSVSGMTRSGGARKRGLNRAIASSAMARTAELLAYKTDWAGGRLVRADRFYPSSRTCSTCGAVRAKLPLSERTYSCPACGNRMDRDLNAAVNLARIAGHAPGVARCQDVEPSARPPAHDGRAAAGREASTPQGDRSLATATCA